MLYGGGISCSLVEAYDTNLRGRNTTIEQKGHRFGDESGLSGGGFSSARLMATLPLQLPYC